MALSEVFLSYNLTKKIVCVNDSKRYILEDLTFVDLDGGANLLTGDTANLAIQQAQNNSLTTAMTYYDTINDAVNDANGVSITVILLNSVSITVNYVVTEGAVITNIVNHEFSYNENMVPSAVSNLRTNLLQYQPNQYRIFQFTDLTDLLDLSGIL